MVTLGLVGDRKGAEIERCPLPVGAVAVADVVPDVLVGAARDLAGQPSVLVANTAGHCVGAASWYRALLRL